MQEDRRWGVVEKALEMEETGRLAGRSGWLGCP